MTADAYISFSKEDLQPWYRIQGITFKRSMTADAYIAFSKEYRGSHSRDQ